MENETTICQFYEVLCDWADLFIDKLVSKEVSATDWKTLLKDLPTSDEELSDLETLFEDKLTSEEKLNSGYSISEAFLRQNADFVEKIKGYRACIGSAALCKLDLAIQEACKEGMDVEETLSAIIEATDEFQDKFKDICDKPSKETQKAQTVFLRKRELITLEVLYHAQPAIMSIEEIGDKAKPTIVKQTVFVALRKLLEYGFVTQNDRGNYIITPEGTAFFEKHFC